MLGNWLLNQAQSLCNLRELEKLRGGKDQRIIALRVVRNPRDDLVQLLLVTDEESEAQRG